MTWIHLAPKFFYYKSKKGGYDAAPRDRECFLETQYVKNIKSAGGRSSGAIDYGSAEDDRLRFVFVLFYAARRFTSSTRSRSR